MRSPLRFRAAVALPGRVDIVVEEVDGRPPENGEVLVEVCASGICASDRHVMESGINFGPGIGVVGPPIVLGHELAGRVVEAGAGRWVRAGGGPGGWSLHPGMRPLRHVRRRVHEHVRDLCRRRRQAALKPGIEVRPSHAGTAVR